MEEPTGGEWTVVNSSHPAAREDANTITFDVPVQKRGKTKLTYECACAGAERISSAGEEAYALCAGEEVVVEFDEQTFQAARAGIASDSSSRRSDFIRGAVRRALWEARGADLAAFAAASDVDSAVFESALRASPACCSSEGN